MSERDYEWNRQSSRRNVCVCLEFFCQKILTLSRLLLAQLHFDSVRTKKTIKKIKAALKALPKVTNAYEVAYDEAMERISKQDDDSKELAMDALTWIVGAMRPLSTAELQHALAIEGAKPELDKQNIPLIEDVVSACA
jgi:hypothetical protein